MKRLVDRNKVVLRATRMLERAIASPERIHRRTERAIRRLDMNLQDEVGDELCLRILQNQIDEKAKRSALIGASLGIPAAIPVIGEIGTMIVSLLSEQLLLMKLEIELCLEMAYLLGRDVSRPSRIFEALSIVACERKFLNVRENPRAAVRRLVDATIKIYSKLGLERVMKKLGLRLEARALRRTSMRLIPLATDPLFAKINYESTRMVGIAASYYYQ